MAGVKITAWVKDVNKETLDLTDDETKLIKYHSNAYADMAVDAPGALNMDMFIVSNGDTRITGQKSYTFNDVESNVFRFSAEDEYGNIGTATVTAPMVDYVRLTCNMANNKPDADGNMILSCSGNYFNGSFGKVSNSLTVSYSYTGSDGSRGSGTMSVTIKSNNSYEASEKLSGLDYQTTYSFSITATDKLETATSSESGVKSLPVFHWSGDDFAFEVPVTFNSTGETRCKGNLRLKGDANFGNTLYFGDGEYCYIKEAADDDLTIRAVGNINLVSFETIDLSAANVTVNGSPISGSGSDSGATSDTWTPYLTAFSSDSVYTTQEGWYQKVGNVVTIGWNIDAIIPSGYDSIDLKIKGVPFSPSINAFGGGVAFGIYTAANIIFEGWRVGTDGFISARLQPCEKASAGNLQIASKSSYPQGGGQVTLAGTICYMTDE